MKPHIKKRIVTSPYDEFEDKVRWCVYESLSKENWFGYGDSIKEAWNDYLIEKMWWENIVSDESGMYDDVDSLKSMIDRLGYPEGYLV